MEKRRALTATLPPDAQDFLVGEKASKQVSKHASMQEEAEGLVTVTVRFRPSLARQLRRIMADRKVEKRRPFTQQEIIQEAVGTWIEENA